MAQRPGVVGPEGLTPQPDRLVRDGDPAFGEQILDVAEAQAKAVVEPDCVTDDLGRKVVAFGNDSLAPGTYEAAAAH